MHRFFKFILSMFILNIFLLTIDSCRSQIEDGKLNGFQCKTINVDLLSNDYVDCDSLFDVVRFIKLETDNKCFIGKIDKLIVTDNEFVVVDKQISKKVYVFNMDGSFRLSLSNNGRGPQEYLGISDVFLMNNDSEVGILDNENGKIMCFDFYGHYLNAIKNVPWYTSIETIDTCTFVGYDFYNVLEDKRSFVVQDYQSNIDYVFGSNCYSSNFSYGREKNLYKSSEGIMGSLNFENTIYKFTKDSVMACYKILTNPPILDDCNIKTDKSFVERRDKMGFFNGRFINSEDVILFSLSTPQSIDLNCIYLKDKCKTMKINNATRDPKFALWSFPVECSDNGFFYHIISASRACGLKDFLYMEDLNDALLDSLYFGLTADSNPIIMVTKYDNE